MLIRGAGPDAHLNPVQILDQAYAARGLDFDLLLLDTALELAAELRAETRVGINIRPCTLRLPGFAQRLHHLLEKHRFDPRRLVLELVESHGPVRLEAARRSLVELRKFGVLVALDDFGPGYPNLDLLAEGLIDFVKLDRSLITTVDSAPFQIRVLEGIIALAEHTGVSLVAEGIETVRQMNIVRRLGIDWMQGFLFGKPEAPQAAPVWPAGIAGSSTPAAVDSPTAHIVSREVCNG